MLRYVLISFLIILLQGCGYKATSVYSKKILGLDIFVDVKTSKIDPQNSVVINDAIRTVVTEELNANLVPKKTAKTIIESKIKSVKFIPIAYDKAGYVIMYKTVVKFSNRVLKDNKMIYQDETIGNYDFNIQSNSAITDTKRYKAIYVASQKAIREFISNIASKGIEL